VLNENNNTRIMQQPSVNWDRKTEKRSMLSWLLSEWHHMKKNREMIFLSLPAFVFKFIFAYLPMFGIVIAFKNYRYDKGILGSEWVGFKNFVFFFTSDTAWRVTRNTILYNCGFIAINTLFGVLFAIMLNEVTRKWLKVFQTSMFLPYFFSWIVVSYATTSFLDMNHGYLNVLLNSFHIKSISWFMEPKYWPFILNAVAFWKGIGYSTLIYYAGTLGIDPTYYEAARIDGASRWQMVTRITVPMLKPLITILIILAVGGIFRADFGLFYFIPNDSSFLYSVTDVIDTLVYRSLLNSSDLGMTAAVGLFQSFVGFMLVITTNTIVKKMNEENSLW
jgi:putative aldouronate transport system permease protein